jgi:hypothetical protein
MTTQDEQGCLEDEVEAWRHFADEWRRALISDDDDVSDEPAQASASTSSRSD